jgi:hypothetical protein
VGVPGAARLHHQRTSRTLRALLRRPLFWVLLAVGLLILVVKLALDPVATHYTRRALEDMDGFRGRFDDVSVGLFPPSYRITKLKVIEVPRGSSGEPLFYADRISARLSGKTLLRGKLVARVRVEGPKLVIVTPKSSDKPKKPEREPRLPDLRAKLAEAPPLLVDRVEIKDGEILFRDLSSPRHPEIWLHDIEAAAETFATRPRLADGRPTTVNASAVVGRSGRLSAFVTSDPFAKGITFSGRVELRGLKVAELHDLLVDRADVKAPRGTVDMFAEFRAENGVINGGVKPVLKDVDIEAGKGGIGTRLKAWVADEALEIFSDRVPGRNAVATTIPIKGKLTSPDLQLMPTILGVIRNAFVEGLTSGFANLPPPTAGKKEGTFKQVKDALTGDEPPEAQPTKREEQPKEKQGQGDDQKKGNEGKKK